MAKIYLTSPKKFDGIINLPVLKISYITSSIDINDYDILLFTSANAVKAIDSFNLHWKNKQSYAIAPKTAESIAESGGDVSYISNSKNGDEFAYDIVKKLKDKKVLYIRAKKTVSNLYTILKKNKINIDELIAYETICNDIKCNESLEKNSIIIFTAPSTIACFFKKFSWDDSYKAIAIGDTTAKHFPKYVSYEISNDISIESCIELAKSIKK